VEVSHRSAAGLVTAQAAVFQTGSGDRVLQFAPASFDAAVSEIFVTLSAGATLCLDRAEALAPGPDLARTLRQRRITFVTLPPTVLRTLDPAGLPELRVLIVAGEACSRELAEKFRRVPIRWR
jgi:non-ribosomal peptide synthetase component F